MSYWQNSLVELIIEARAGVAKVQKRAQKAPAVEVGVGVSLLLVKALLANPSFLVGRELMQRLQQVGDPIITDCLARF